jgi:hypothetical protein
MSTKQLTDFKDRLRTALERQSDHETLLAMVRQHYAEGGTKSEAYDALQEIWEGYGYANLADDETDSKRATLEYVLERVWYWGD